jgi:hypothetical protein
MSSHEYPEARAAFTASVFTASKYRSNVAAVVAVDCRISLTDVLVSRDSLRA